MHMHVLTPMLPPPHSDAYASNQSNALTIMASWALASFLALLLTDEASRQPVASNWRNTLGYKRGVAWPGLGTWGEC